MKNALAIVALSTCITTAAAAESTPAVPQGFLACSKIQNEDERVRCYDAQVAAMKNAGHGAAPAAASPSSAEPTAAAGKSTARTAPAPSSAAPATPAPAGSAPVIAGRAATPPASITARGSASTAHFGEEDLPQSRRPKSNHANETLASSITAMSKGAQGIYYFSLANGQVWRADGSEFADSSMIGVLFHVGAPIRIERGTLGSYHMWAPAIGAKNWMYVRRIR